MIKMTETKKREIWIDNIKVIACVLVVLGHFFQSMVKSDICPETTLYTWFDQTIYFFHVPLFFLCSGYFYKQSGRGLKAHWHLILKKLWVLGVPYFVFGTASYILKNFFSDAVNTQPDSLLETFFTSPAAPYWYLFTLFFLFAFLLPVETKRSAFILIILSAVLFLTIKPVELLFQQQTGFSLPFFLSSIARNMIWFVLGVFIRVFNLKKILRKPFWLLGIPFLVLSVLSVQYNLRRSQSFRLLMGMLACIAVVSAVLYICKNNRQSKLMMFLSQYTMPIFLMHTIFAAGMRSILLKLDVTSLPLHILLGLLSTFLLPILAMIILEKLKPLDFIVYPNRHCKKK